MNRVEHLLIGLLLALCANAAHAALAFDRSAPIQIEADTALIDEPAGTATYRGRVVLVQGTIRLQATELVVYVVNGKATKSVSSGAPVLLDQAATGTEEAIHAEARKITFLIEENRMLLDNMATLRQGQRLFQGAHIDYNVEARKVNASGSAGSRVMLVLPPSAPPAQPGAPAPEAKAETPRQRATLQPAAGDKKP